MSEPELGLGRGGVVEDLPAGGNTTTVKVTIAISAKRSALTTARFRSTWKQSRVKGSLILAGTVPRAGTYAVDLMKGKRRLFRRAFGLRVGTFTLTLTLALPRTLLPGRYRVTLVPPLPATQVLPATRDLTLTAPASRVVDSATLARTGSTMRASFHFAAVPKGRLRVSWYLTSKGRRHRLGTASKAAAARVTSVFRVRRKHGTITAVIARKGVVIAQRSIALR